MTSAVQTKPISCFLVAGSKKPTSFLIKAYQRGYRWRSSNVTQLLNDLDEFLNEKPTRRPFYCLQPLVVKKVADHESMPPTWEVVDGQQRLTTLFLIFKSLTGSPPYTLCYESRPHSTEFLEKIDGATPDEKFNNIDFHHIYHARRAIEVWFGTDEAKRERFKKLLANSDADGRNVRIIWYELTAADVSEDTFTNLNDRKIPLTDEELIRALFLSNPERGALADSAFQHRLALEWDRIETALREPGFWGFVSNQPPRESGCIRLVFELCAPPPVKKDADPEIFNHYQKRLAGDLAEKPSDVWREIVACYEQLEEWYRDPELFNLVGFYATILSDESIGTLRELLMEAKKDDTTKQKFAADLRLIIRKELIGKIGEKTVSAFVGDLTYDTKRETRRALALFNIATILRTTGVQIRFPFHLYHNTIIGWDIEHVQSKAGDRLKNKTSQLSWLDACRAELMIDAKSSPSPGNQEKAVESKNEKTNPEEMIAAIDEFKRGDSKLEFPELEKKIRAYFGEMDTSESEVDSIGNLTLLDAPTNRGYGNAPFAVKRSKIIKLERPEGTFILPCTRDLFLKVYSENPRNLRRWDIRQDGDPHETAIIDSLEIFFGEKKKA